MPGCTVPYCSNNTSKGFKVYHFPRDAERNLLWVKNCGKGQDWQPTSHMCICEVHFEDSQFESHRADGLRKLKPNAVPTIFKLKPSRARTKSLKRNPDRMESASSSYVQVILDGSSVLMNSDLHQPSFEPESAHTFKSLSQANQSDNVVNYSITSDVFADHTYPKNQNVMSSDHNEIMLSVPPSDEMDSPDALVAHQLILTTDGDGKPSSEKSLRWKQSQQCSTSNISSTCVSVLTNNPSSSCKTSKITSKQDFSKNIKCYLCGNIEENETVIPLNSLTETSKVNFHQKLRKIAHSNNIPLTAQEDGLLCSHCMELLNYADRIEFELTTINETIINQLRQKTELLDQPNDLVDATNSINELGQESVTGPSGSKLLKHSEDACVELSFTNEFEKCTTPQTTPPEEMQCCICRFKTQHKSYMFYHLRQHLKNSIWCDFCQKTLQGSENHEHKNDSHDNVSGTDCNIQTIKSVAKLLPNSVETIYEETQQIAH